MRLIFVILSTIFLLIGIAYKVMIFWLNSEYCREFCFPYHFDMMDENTCTCWLPNGHLVVEEVRYE